MINRRADKGVIIHADTGILELQIVNQEIVRIRSDACDSVTSGSSLIIADEVKEPPVFSVETKDGQLILMTEKINVLVNLKNGYITFLSKDNIQILELRKRIIKPCVIPAESAYTIRQYFQWKEGEALLGLGQHQEGIMNWRGHRVDIWQSNMVAAVPVIISSEGYGILWDNYSFTTFSDASGDPYIESEVADGIDFYFIYGPEPDAIISGYRSLTGKAPLFPKWAYGYIQSRERYKTQDEVLATVSEYRERNIPLDVIVLDWQYWKTDWWGQKSFNPLKFPDPAGMMEVLHEKHNAHLMISIWPQMASDSPDFKEMMEHPGYLYEPDEAQSCYDAFHESARNLYWEQANKGIFSYGIDAWWCDATEPELRGWNWDPENYRKFMKPAIGSGARYMNAYSLMQSKGIYENQRNVNPEKRVFNLTRSAFAGQQRYAAATWSGDIDATWVVFRKQIAAGLNFCMSGIPYWTTDIGAFFIYGVKNWKVDRPVPEKIGDEEYKELYVRWFQFGAFCPLFRSHGTDLPREIWKFGEPGDLHYDILVKYDRLRYRLMPYIYSTAGMVTHHDYTMMRPLMMDFRHDTKVFEIDNQYMFGPAIMVCPVTEPGVKEWSVYLPENKGGWYDFWTGKHLEGGQNVTIPVTLEVMPLFIRAGSIIPLGGFIQYADEKPVDPVELRIYPGSNGKFLLYDDENDGYNYEKGVYSEIQIEWHNSESSLVLGKRFGQYPGMPEEFIFNVVIVSEGHGAGLQIEKNPEKSIIYDGEDNTIILSKRVI